MFDVIIVGGGSAGLSAALVLGRARRHVLVCDKGTPRNTPAHHSHSFFTRDGTPPLELLEIGRRQLEPYDTVEYRATGVQEIEKAGEGFRAFLADGTTAQTRKILLCSGVTDEFPPIENFEAFWGNSVFHCPFCHGWELRDRPLAVLGNGAEALHMVSLLYSWSADLVLCTNGASTLTAEQRELLTRHNVAIREEKLARLEGNNGQLENIVFETGDKLPRHGMLVRPKQHLRSDLAEKLGCELYEPPTMKTRLVRVADFNETSVKGVYAAGDMTAPMQQIVAAAAQGAMAAIGINQALIAEDFK